MKKTITLWWKIANIAPNIIQNKIPKASLVKFYKDVAGICFV